jgi:hypothetical protein
MPLPSLIPVKTLDSLIYSCNIINGWRETIQFFHFGYQSHIELLGVIDEPRKHSTN